MENHDNILQIVIFLFAAVGSVAIFRMLRLSPVLGYLLAGLLIGPYGFKLVEQGHTTHSFAEFGVIFLMFMIGLELSLDRLKAMRSHVFHFGSLQVIITALLIMGASLYWGATEQQAIIIGGALAFSSTAIVLQTLGESGQKFSQVGRLSIAILILQDLAVIPLLVLLQVFSTDAELSEALLYASVKAFVAVAVMLIGGRIFFRPLFRFVASLRDNELLTGAILLIVMGAAYASYVAGMSPAMGAFLAGLLIAETEFKPQVEADIQPYKALFLGLFFMTVGMTLDWRLILEKFEFITLLVLGLLATKAIIIFLLARLFKFGVGPSLHAGILLAQSGEFAFVVLGLAVSSQLVPGSLGQILLVVVTITMALTPMMAEMGRRFAKKQDDRVNLSLRHASDDTHDLRDHVIICGFGRVGHTVARLLEAEQISYIALEINPEIVTRERAAGIAVHYGDGSRKLVLKAVGLERAKAIVITHADPALSGKTIIAIRGKHPNIPIIVRAKNLPQVEWLERLGANVAVAEMFETSLQLGGALLTQLGVDDQEVTRVIHSFRAEDYALTREAEASLKTAAAEEQ